jgi:hypothetical protein
VIRYALICEAAHEFDAWFRDSAAYDEQAASGAILCPYCRSTKVGKAVMAPHVTRRGAHRGRKDDAAGNDPLKDAAEAAGASAPDADAGHALLREKLRELRETILSATEDVGERFPTEARKMQDGAARPRPIRGRATLEEAKALVEEGIPVLPLPREGH